MKILTPLLHMNNKYTDYLRVVNWYRELYMESMTVTFVCAKLLPPLSYSRQSTSNPVCCVPPVVLRSLGQYQKKHQFVQFKIHLPYYWLQLGSLGHNTKKKVNLCNLKSTLPYYILRVMQLLILLFFTFFRYVCMVAHLFIKKEAIY